MTNINQGRKYDKSKIDALFKEIDSSNNGEISLNEFCTSYALKVESYEMKVLECKRRSTEIRHEITDINTQKQEIARAEIMNQFGIMEGSVLIVTICEGKDLDSWEIGRGIDPFVVLQCEGQRIETSYKSNTYDPIWNE
mmetsp:Transcript_4825/g.4074  ORF Transcript_4825/g.4074 Transcript_4825/m.4074 type:complete len:139 (+) Transcript_4825:177-593(+)